ncbi:MAG: DNA-formamidopyrimidine glycosylase family protein, partial [Mycobacterium sp.]
MPELPEVETVRRGLDAAVRGRRIDAVTMLWRPFVDTADGAVEAIVGQRIAGVRRRGKVLIVDFKSERSLLLHLKMTGQVVIHRRGRIVFAGGHPTPSLLGPMPNDTTRVTLTLTGNITVYVNDSRKFGWMRIVTTAALQADPFLSRLGPEPRDT